MGNALLVLLAFCVYQTINIACIIMSQEELRSYRLNSMEEPTDEMLEAIMLGVQEHARQSTIKAKAELDRRFTEAKAEIARRRVERVGA